MPITGSSSPPRPIAMTRSGLVSSAMWYFRVWPTTPDTTSVVSRTDQVRSLPSASTRADTATTCGSTTPLGSIEPTKRSSSGPTVIRGLRLQSMNLRPTQAAGPTVDAATSPSMNATTRPALTASSASKPGEAGLAGIGVADDHDHARDFLNAVPDRCKEGAVTHTPHTPSAVGLSLRPAGLLL